MRALALAFVPIVAFSQPRPPREASQYDFLLGRWELVAMPKVSSLAARIHGQPKLRGTWTAARALDGWGIVDDMRLTDESGNPRASMHFVRLYDPSAHRWAIAAADAFQQRIVSSTAQWTTNEMMTTGDGYDGEGKRYLSRTRLTRITATSFRYQLDRSYDGGKTWDDARLVIDAKRVAAAGAR